MKAKGAGKAKKESTARSGPVGGNGIRRKARSSSKKIIIQMEEILERVSDGFVAFDAGMNYTYVNGRGAEMLGRKPEDLIGKNYWVEFPEARSTPFAKAYVKALEMQETLVIEDYYAPWDRWFENRIYPSKDGLSIFFTEITERKKTEMEIRRERDLNARIMETSPIGITVVDAEGKITFANSRAEEILGLSKDHIQQRDYNAPSWRITDFNGQPFPDQQLPFRRVATTKIPARNVQHAIEWPDGRRILLSINAAPLVSNGGKFDGMVATLEAITERTRAELLLALESQIFQKIFSGASLQDILNEIVLAIEALSIGTIASILLLDPDGIHVRYGSAPHLPPEYNNAIEGAPIGPGAGSCGTAMYLRQQVVVTDIETDPLWDAYRELARMHGLRACWSTPIIGSNGSVLASFAMYYREPRSPSVEDFELIERVTHLAQVAIQRKRAEEELQTHRQLLETVVNFIPAAVSLLRGSDLRVQLINPVYQAIAPGKQMLGKTWDELWSETGQNFTAICRQVLETGEPYHVVDELNMIRRIPDGAAEPAYFSWSLHRVRLPGDAGWGLLGTAWETTGRKRAEDEVRLSRDRLADLSRRLVESHETEQRAIGRELHDQIGQMLTALKLIMETAPQLPRELREKKHAQAQELVDDLMNRVSALSLELRPPMLDDLGLIPALLWHINRYQDQTGLQVDFKHSDVEGKRYDPEIETTAYRLIQESLTNVARHAHAKRARLEVRARGEWMEIQIEDDGAGFDPQAAFAKHRGLSGMRERVNLLGGSFQIESQPGRGTKKFFQLPLREKTT